VLIVLILKILAAWAICAMVVIGLGTLIIRRYDGSSRIFYAFWIGFGAATAFLDTWNLFLPIHESAPICLSAIACVGILENGAELWRELAAFLKMLGWSALIWIGLIGFLALRVAGPCDHYDTGLYGAAAIRWITTYPTVPGLANLHARFGFNISLFPLAAAVQEGLSRLFSFRLLTGFTLAALWSSIFPSCLRVIRERTADLADWYFAVLAIPVVFWAARARIIGTDTDEPAAAACLLGAGLVLAEIVSATGREFDGERRTQTAAWATLLALAVSLKESTAVFAALTWVIGFLLTPWPKRKTQRILASVAPAVLVLVPWLVRGILLSGYPFFPNPTFGIHVTWTVPRVVASFFILWNRAYARIPFAPVASTLGTAWLRPWLHKALHDRGGVQIPALMSAAGACVVCLSGRRKLGHTGTRAAWILAASIPGIIFWFVEIPDPRFGEGPIWATAAVLGAMGIVAVTKSGRVHRATVLASLFALTLWCVFSFGWQRSYLPSLSVRRLEPLPVPKLVARRTLSGLIVYVPAQGDQCWGVELPCTPYFNQTLRLRVPGNMRWGFSSKGMPELPRH
jgi:hypothetical protein